MLLFKDWSLYFCLQSLQTPPFLRIGLAFSALYLRKEGGNLATLAAGIRIALLTLTN